MNKSSLKIPTEMRLIYRGISDEEKEIIFDFINQQVSDLSIFNLATVFGDQKLNWNDTPLMKIYKMTGNEKIAAILLGYLTMECLINSEQSWGCVKTDITRRDFETNSYFKIDEVSQAA
jgi:hypothetical protein